MSGPAEKAPSVGLLEGSETELRSLARIDRALIGLRHLWSTPPQVQDPSLGSIDMSTVLVVDALTQAENSPSRTTDHSNGPRQGVPPGGPSASSRSPWASRIPRQVGWSPARRPAERLPGGRRRPTRGWSPCT